MANFNNSNIYPEANIPFRWYDNPLKRNIIKRHCKGLQPYKLLMMQHYFLPFTIIRKYKAQSITDWKVIAEDGTITYIDIALIERKSILDKDYFIYKGDHHGFMFDCGYYRSEISDGDDTFYSEDFYITTSGYCEDLCVNGGFDSDLSGWTVSGFGGIVWDAGTCLLSAGLFGKSLLQNFPLNSEIQISFEISDCNFSGSASAQIGLTNVFSITGNGRFTFRGNTETNGIVNFSFTSAWAGRIDNVRIQLISDTSHPCSLVLDWWSDCDFGNIYYRSGFKNRFIFDQDTQIGEPTYRVITENTTDGDGIITKQSKKRQKIYQIESVFPEYIVDALIDMQLHPFVKLYAANCIGSDIVKEVTVTPQKWEQGFKGCMNTVRITFVIDTLIESGCCDNLNDCVQPCYDAIETYSSECVDGKYYLGTGGNLLHCDNGNLIPVPCESGLVRHDSEDLVSHPFPPFWIWDSTSSTWIAVPQILNIDQPDSQIFSFVITALIVTGTVGQLQISTDGVNWSDVQFALLDKDEWLTDGFTMTLNSDTEYFFRINSFNDICTYGVSEQISYTTTPDQCLVCFNAVASVPGTTWVSIQMNTILIDITSPIDDFIPLENYLNSLAISGIVSWSVTDLGGSYQICAILEAGGVNFPFEMTYNNGTDDITTQLLTSYQLACLCFDSLVINTSLYDCANDRWKLIGVNGDAYQDLGGSVYADWIPMCDPDALKIALDAITGLDGIWSTKFSSSTGMPLLYITYARTKSSVTIWDKIKLYDQSADTEIEFIPNHSC